MPTECRPKRFEFEAVARRAVVACFDGGDITSNATSPRMRGRCYWGKSIAAWA
jgi:hypothetical protein